MACFCCPRLVTFVFVLSIISSAQSNHHAKKLYEKLFEKTGYNKIVRPVKNAEDKISVKIGLKLSQLIDVVGITIIYCIL